MNEASVTRVTGMSSDVWRKGGQLQCVNATAAPSEAASSIPVTNVHAYPLVRVHEWFHGPDCKKVEINKQTKRKYVRKNFILPGGKLLALGCEHRIRCSKTELNATWTLRLKTANER